MSSSHLLKLAIPLVTIHGFTREALSRSVLTLPTPHAEPLSDTAVTALFGRGDDARRTLIKAWMDDAIHDMRAVPSPSIKATLRARLQRNEPVLQYLPEAFAVLITPMSGSSPVDLLPVAKHATTIADEACYLTGETSADLSWYTRRALLAAVYTAAELHQLTSPQTAYAFLDSILDDCTRFKSSLDDINLFIKYIGRSGSSIIKSIW